MRDYLQKALTDLPPGEQDPKRSFVHHYTHLLPDKLREEGYEINITDGLNGLGQPELVVRAMAPKGDTKGRVGFLDASPDSTSNSVRIHEAYVGPEHRSRGLGMVMYEALLAHAKQSGFERVHGGHHSTLAHKVHAKLAAKHGLSYEGTPALGGTYRTVGEWDRAESGDHDEKYDSYDYTLKSEQPLGKTSSRGVWGAEEAKRRTLGQAFKASAFRHIPTGQVHVTGNFHNIEELPCRSAGFQNDEWEAGFIDHDDRFFNRQDAAKQIGIVGHLEAARYQNDEADPTLEGQSNLPMGRARWGARFTPQGDLIKKAEQSLMIPDRFLSKAEPNLFIGEELRKYEDAAVMQTNAWERLSAQLDAARRLRGWDDYEYTIPQARQLFAEEDTDDPAAVALAAYDIPVTEANRIALQAALDTPEFGKSELLTGPVTYKIVPVTGEAVTIADAVQRAADAGYINAVKLNGKHSKGTMLAKDPQTKKVYLLKPGSGKNSPAKGVSETSATQSEREAAFWHVADAWGIGDAFPRADLILVNNHQTAAMELLGTTFRNLGSKKREDLALPARILEPYRQNATLFKWSLLDMVLGNPDRHSQNMMVDPENRVVKLIDHGSALAGEGFDPVGDDNSFIPFYLRAWTNRKFKDMTAQERMRAMPGLDRRAEQIFDQWVEGLDEDVMAEILQDYHVNPDPALSRLAMIRAMPGPKWVVLNKMWSGAI